MNRAYLLAKVKGALGIDKDAELARQLGIGRAFFCLVKSGKKNMPQKMVDNIVRLTGWSEEKITAMIDGGKDEGTALRQLPDVLTTVQHEPDVLQGAVSGDAAEAAPAGEVRGDQAAGGEGTSQPDDLIGEPGNGAQAPIPNVPRTRLKRGTRAAIILKEGGIYYPDVPGNGHTFRRVIGIVRNVGKEPAVVYSYGGDSNGICTRNTFLRWLDPARAA